ncbi:hypothetical protein V6X63_09810 [Spiribacter sp. 221]|uniref:hypothetical protein n=1 Tax=Spiribacter onubensis TaxID=3122420 RepID=UPI00349F458A
MDSEREQLLDKSSMRLLILFPGLMITWILLGAIPGISLPTAGQAVWTIGFAQSMAGNPTWLWATHIGNPEPAAISFGLSGAFLTSLFIRAGLNPIDAYALMALVWYSVAYLGAYGLSRMLGAGTVLSAVLGLLWMLLPVVHFHVGYSMLSIGIALIPFYFFTTLKMVGWAAPRNPNYSGVWAAVFPFVVVLAAFMDGYTFVFFAVGASIMLGWLILQRELPFGLALKKVLPLHFVSFAIGYLLYVLYIGKSGFEGASLDFFRGWGADLLYFLLPTQGMVWFWDVVGLSVARPPSEHFGDSSVWSSPYALPLVVFGLAGWYLWKRRNTGATATAFLLIAIVGTYMSLGPSFKVDATKPDPALPSVQAEEYAGLPTGTGVLSANLPGFENMRASYRWIALGLFGFWALTVLGLTSLSRNNVVLKFALSATLLVLVAPNIFAKWEQNQNHRLVLERLHAEVITPAGEYLAPGERVAFMPWGNDFLVNWIASDLRISAYNIGGDKNLAHARSSWPETLQAFPQGKIDEGFAERAVLALARDEVDVLVLPFVDMLWAAHAWPSTYSLEDEVRRAAERLGAAGDLNVVIGEHLAYVRPADAQLNASERARMESRVLDRLAWKCPEKTMYLANELPSIIGHEEGDSLVAEQGDGKGFLSFGPYLRLPPGQHTAYILYRAHAAKHVEIGYIDVVSDSGRNKFIVESVGGSAGKDAVIRVDFELKEVTERVEVRFFSYGVAPVSLRSLNIECDQLNAKNN